MGTASLGMIFVGLFGYYVISNAIRRDVVTRCGVIAASTPMRSGEYLLGKFLGNLVFLATFVCGFMLSSMVMLAVRGEARLEPFVFIEQYLLLTPAGDCLRLGRRGPLRIDSVARGKVRRRHLFLFSGAR